VSPEPASALMWVKTIYSRPPISEESSGIPGNPRDLQGICGNDSLPLNCGKVRKSFPQIPGWIPGGGKDPRYHFVPTTILIPSHSRLFLQILQNVDSIEVQYESDHEPESDEDGMTVSAYSFRPPRVFLTLFDNIQHAFIHSKFHLFKFLMNSEAIPSGFLLAQCV
jgi:hypothetical protein